MDLRNWEFFAGTSAAVVGANVSVYEASLSHPNPNSALATTTTNSDGMWSFTGLSDTPKDVKVEYAGRVKWYKGLTLHSVYSVRENADDPANVINLLPNGGFEVNTTGQTSWSPGTGDGAILDGWTARRGTGDTLTINQVATPTSPNSQKALELVYTKSGGDAFVQCILPTTWVYALRGKTISASVQMRQSAANMARCQITDGVTTTNAGFSATTGSYVTSAVNNFVVSPAATDLRIGVIVSASGTLHLDNAMLNLGVEAEAFVLHPADGDVYVITEAAPASDAGTVRTLLNALAERVRALGGLADWKDAVAVSLVNKVSKAGDAMTGALTLANNIGYRCFDNAGGPRDMVKVTSDNVGEFGNPNFGINRLWAFSNDGLKARYVNGPGSNTDHTIWHAGNVGANSGLDADKLDGQHGSYYQARTNHTGTQAPSTISPQGAGSTLDADLLDGQHGSYYQARGNHTGTQAPSTISPQGAGSGLDADLLDGQHASAFAGSGHNHDSAYASSSHNHDDAYANLLHTHNANARTATGTYTGNGAGSRSIPTGLNTIYAVLLQCVSGGAPDMVILTNHDGILLVPGSSVGTVTGHTFSGGSFTVTSGGGFNNPSKTYRWVALGV